MVLTGNLYAFDRKSLRSSRCNILILHHKKAPKKGKKDKKIKKGKVRAVARAVNRRRNFERIKKSQIKGQIAPLKGCMRKKQGTLP